MLKHPLLAIWTQPRATIRSLVETGSSSDVIIFACLSGVARSLDNAANRDLGDKHPIGLILVLALTIGPISGVVWLWLYAFLIEWTGEFLKGKATYHEIKTAIAWGWFPKVVSLAPWTIALSIAAPEFFSQQESDFEEMSPGYLLAVAASAVAIVACNVWSIFTTCQGLAEVQRYQSGWKAFGNLTLAMAVIVVPLVLLLLTATSVLHN